MNNAKWDNNPVRKQDASVKVGLSTKQKSRQNCWHQTDSNQKRRLWIYLLLRECFWYSFNLGPNIFQFVKFRKIHAIKQACADIWYLDKQQIVKEIKRFFTLKKSSGIFCRLIIHNTCSATKSTTKLLKPKQFLKLWRRKKLEEF